MATRLSHVQIRPSCESTFEAAARDLAEAVMATEPGCLMYTVGRVLGEERTYIVAEHYVDNAALAAHEEQTYIRSFGILLEGCADGSPAVHTVRDAPPPVEADAASEEE